MDPLTKLAKTEVRIEKKHLLTLWAFVLGTVCAGAAFLLILAFEEYRDLRLGALMFWLLGVVRELRYVGLFAICYLAAVIIPLPAGAVLMAAAFEARLGNFDLALVVLTGIAGTVAGDNFGYWLARRYGEGFLKKAGFGRLLRSPLVAHLGERIDAHPAAAIFLSRFITTAAPLANLLMGLRKLPYMSFLAYDLLGETCVVLLNVAVGVLFEERWEYLYKLLGLSGIIVLCLIVLTVTLSARRALRRRHGVSGAS
ncbi:MAG TPA: DedA family protein [Candidatus Binatia bacterium]|jgi:membrane protein DedA with SNARE-associated domain|nr:DedA family protein [Candidatus Binatia bacterium]